MADMATNRWSGSQGIAQNGHGLSGLPVASGSQPPLRRTVALGVGAEWGVHFLILLVILLYSHQ
jgi:hypothetical protein